MRTYITIGSCPSNEPCAQLGEEDNRQRARLECGRFAEQIRRHYPEPEHGYLITKGFSHDFGTYFEVCAVFDDEDDISSNWAYEVEGDPLEVLTHWEKPEINA